MCASRQRFGLACLNCHNYSECQSVTACDIYLRPATCTKLQTHVWEERRIGNMQVTCICIVMESMIVRFEALTSESGRVQSTELKHL